MVAINLNLDNRKVKKNGTYPIMLTIKYFGVIRFLLKLQNILPLKTPYKTLKKSCQRFIHDQFCSSIKLYQTKSTIQFQNQWL